MASAAPATAAVPRPQGTGRRGWGLQGAVQGSPPCLRNSDSLGMGMTYPEGQSLPADFGVSRKASSKVGTLHLARLEGQSTGVGEAEPFVPLLMGPGPWAGGDATPTARHTTWQAAAWPLTGRTYVRNVGACGWGVTAQGKPPLWVGATQEDGVPPGRGEAGPVLQKCVLTPSQSQRHRGETQSCQLWVPSPDTAKARLGQARRPELLHWVSHTGGWAAPCTASRSVNRGQLPSVGCGAPSSG